VNRSSWAGFLSLPDGYRSAIGVLASLTISHGSIRASSSPFRLKLHVNGGVMVTTINDNMFSDEAMHDPYYYYGRIRDETRSTGTSCMSSG